MEMCVWQFVIVACLAVTTEPNKFKHRAPLNKTVRKIRDKSGASEENFHPILVKKVEPEDAGTYGEEDQSDQTEEEEDKKGGKTKKEKNKTKKSGKTKKRNENNEEENEKMWRPTRRNETVATWQTGKLAGIVAFLLICGIVVNENILMK
ncbi:hypothetical protein HELRODRAFT_165540 [Helobdella robusta]|uniref:Uncharacterized protein n=1 Tax=Helobdella robusta TaxID=6412 RepID=T1EWZ6_HELRO|nr:hypothetical protein HELRODRAFT_165540 [Helobdella robusta]ESN91498.1 hypothetical protein HELRODRAFT_165540 [Helobdella robusta]